MYLTHEQQARIAGQIMAGLVNIHMTDADLRAAARLSADAARALAGELQKDPNLRRTLRRPSR